MATQRLGLTTTINHGDERFASCKHSPAANPTAKIFYLPPYMSIVELKDTNLTFVENTSRQLLHCPFPIVFQVASELALLSARGASGVLAMPDRAVVGASAVLSAVLRLCQLLHIKNILPSAKPERCQLGRN
jgi:hypothetical protein